MNEVRPDPNHEAVLASRARHLVVTAPPGTGKTFLSVRLAGELVPILPTEARVLLLTFSTQARSQLEREAARQLPPKLRARIAVTNYHRFFWQGVRAYRRALGLPPSLDIGSRQRRRQALERIDSGAVKKLRPSEGLVESLAEHAFPEFRDHRTPDRSTLARLLQAVEQEQSAGRLVFDDLGALFWSLLERFPAVDQAFQARYPVVVADEHQDASALQDAVVRRLARDRLVVFADPMQLIHEFRGASHARVERHLADCEEHMTLNTPHRWHGGDELAGWLLTVRARLGGEDRPGAPPPQLAIVHSPAAQGFNGVKPKVRFAVSRAFKAGARIVAVLARTNDQVADLRAYLSTQGQYPRQVGTEDFEEARLDIEQLPQLLGPRAVAARAVERLGVLVPTIPSPLLAQVRKRLLPDTINLERAGDEAARILRALEPIYLGGSPRYFESLLDALQVCAEAEHHLPRVEAVRALRHTAQALMGAPPDLDLALKRYSEEILDAAHAARRVGRGLLLMTAHQAKGKEFDAVVLAGASQRFWPDDAETRRLLYVVVTRATASWTVVAPNREASPLLRFLTGD